MQWKCYRYNLTSEGAVITQYLPEDEEVQFLQIPSQIEGYPVVEIGPEAFSECGSCLERIEVPDSVKKLSRGAFKMCMSLTELILHEGLEVVEEEAFYLTPMEVLALPDSLKEIRNPWEMGEIRLELSERNQNFATDGYGFYKAGKEQELLVILQQEERTEYQVMAGTTIIGENAIAGNNFLQKVTLPDTVHRICRAAFEGCQNLGQVVFPEGLREIQANAFSHCISLRSMVLPASLEVLGEHAISDTFGWSESLNGLEKIVVDEKNPHFYVEKDALFQKMLWGENSRKASCSERGKDQKATQESFVCQLVKYFGRDREYQIPVGVTNILPSAFRRSSFYRFHVPASVKDVGKDAFRECKNLEEIYLEESDTMLYVPRQPIYRKDEITDLFCSREREERRQNQAVEEVELPEKWQSFARMPIYSRKKTEKQNPYEQYVFDYKGYDALFHTYLNLPDQYGMAICRLKYPVLLETDVREKYVTFLNEHLLEILESISEAQDQYHLAALAELGFFTEENIEEAMDVFNRNGRTAQMSYLLNYKREHLAEMEFDFSL